jgi:hypothetical protein
MALFLKVKLPGRAVDHSSPFVQRIRMMEVNTLPSLYAFMAWAGTTRPYMQFCKPFMPFDILTEVESNSVITS